MFGAVQFSGYTCAGETITHNCFVDAQFFITATNIGEVDQSVTALEFTFDGESTSLLDEIDEADRALGPAESLTTSASAVVGSALFQVINTAGAGQMF